MKINDRIDLGTEIDSLIVAHCNSHSCCMEDNKSEIVNDILDFKSPPFDWIKIEDKLPKPDQNILIVDPKTKEVRQAWMDMYHIRDLIFNERHDPKEIKYWMPLPSPPKTSRLSSLKLKD